MANVTISEQEYAKLKRSESKLKELRAQKHVQDVINDLEANRVKKVL